MSKEALSHEEQRKYLWVNAWISTANSPDCKKSNIATKWADEALKAFDERFPMSPYCVHEWEPIWDNNSSLTSVKHRCLKCGEIQ